MSDTTNLLVNLLTHAQIMELLSQTLWLEKIESVAAREECKYCDWNWRYESAIEVI